MLGLNNKIDKQGGEIGKRVPVEETFWDTIRKGRISFKKE
ncbi:hypothetical protein ADIARSV_2684 [Arcticibacter svalbardensis MN12-7]|uniref:Uncharacterized protein n=1 Tax=Arcticibacter svalbardensis MN12-7 TaxID=1150600 RepID=R9GQS2_9SPHI|nr:hypothetical protein ADIARSV_2684 [Arcticibacter svalbardensis MN12-7]